MKSKFFLFFVAALALLFAGCSKDEKIPEPDIDDSKDLLYMDVTVQLPVSPGTRSETVTGGGSSSGIEYGSDDENRVNSLLLVLATKDNKFIGCAEKSDELTQSSASATVNAVQSISKSVLSAYYGDDGVLTSEEKEVNVFVFCNPTDALKLIFDGIQAGNTDWYDQVCSVSVTPESPENSVVWGGSDRKGGFLMSSNSIAGKRFPTKFEDWNLFTTKETPFKLSGTNTGLTGEGMESTIDNPGAIKVERSVARFDFKDGSPATTAANTYNVIFDKDNTNCLVQIELTKMALVNMSKYFYYLRRVSDDGTNTAANLCEPETPLNYVVDTDAKEKKDGSIVSAKKYSDYFNFCLGHIDGDKWTIDQDARTQWSTSTISDVLNGQEDDNNGWNQDGTKGDYRVWRYVTENTIPAVEKQQIGITTGVVFKGKMVATDHDTESSLYKALSATTPLDPSDPILYAYGPYLFVTWKEVRAFAKEQVPGSPMYKAVFGNTTVTPVLEDSEGNGAVYSDDVKSPDFKWKAWYYDDRNNEAKLLDFKTAATGSTFTLYERSEDNGVRGYYCYYYYYNRHNDNGKPSVMCPMEFAVVRNNVYKLAVTGISKLGHPRISDNDPDPVDPEDPDETGDVRLSVSVEVLPWVVRVNNIEF